MYNSIYPININYRKPQNLRKVKSEDNSQASTNTNPQQNQTFPNGTKVSIDYTKGQINISQVLTDFRSTIIAINAPDDVRQEVGTYLSLVEKESLKENPSKDIIVSNLKNASRISDDFIAKSLNKPSNVVEGWIDALFLQKINLKSDPNEINPDFQLEFPKQTQKTVQAQNEPDTTKEQKQEESFGTTQGLHISSVGTEAPEENFDDLINQDIQNPFDDFEISQAEQYNIESSYDISQNTQVQNTSQDLFSPTTQSDELARELYLSAKSMPKTNKGDTQAINLLNEALGILENNTQANKNIRAALHYERGKIFDSYDYVSYALRDYWEATKSDDNNLKAQAYYKSAKIYDEFKEYDPALNSYFSSIAYSGEADNSRAQTIALSSVADLFAKKYDLAQFVDFSSLAIESAQETQNNTLIAQTYSGTAQNYQQFGDDNNALDNYKNALANYFSTQDPSNYKDMAFNYEQAAIVMENLGNHAKANNLRLKALQYYQKVQLGA